MEIHIRRKFFGSNRVTALRFIVSKIDMLPRSVCTKFQVSIVFGFGQGVCHKVTTQNTGMRVNFRNTSPRLRASRAHKISFDGCYLSDFLF